MSCDAILFLNVSPEETKGGAVFSVVISSSNVDYRVFSVEFWLKRFGIGRYWLPRCSFFLHCTHDIIYVLSLLAPKNESSLFVFYRIMQLRITRTSLNALLRNDDFEVKAERPADSVKSSRLYFVVGVIF